MDKYYSTEELAGALHVTTRFIREEIKRGEFGETLNTSRHHFVSESNLKTYIARHTGPAYSEKQEIIPIRHRHRTVDCMAKI